MNINKPLAIGIIFLLVGLGIGYQLGTWEKDTIEYAVVRGWVNSKSIFMEGDYEHYGISVVTETRGTLFAQVLDKDVYLDYHCGDFVWIYQHDTYLWVDETSQRVVG